MRFPWSPGSRTASRSGARPMSCRRSATARRGCRLRSSPWCRRPGWWTPEISQAAQRGTVVRGHEPRRLPDHAEPPDQHQPHPRGRGISPDGELISGSRSAVETGVPVLGRLPGIGRLFRTDAVQEDRTEVMVMVTPYVIADHEEGGAHPADPGTARSVHATHVVMRAGGAILGPRDRVLAPAGRRSYGVTGSNCWVCPCVRGGTGPPAMLVSGSWGASSAPIKPDRSRATTPDRLFASDTFYSNSRYLRDSRGIRELGG